VALADEDVIFTRAYDSTQAGNGTAEVRFWSEATRQPLGPTLQQAPNVYWWLSPDGRTVLTGRPRLDTSVQRWDVATGQPRGEPLPLEGGIEWVAFHPDSTIFVTSARRASPSGYICEGRIWDTVSGRLLGTLFSYLEKDNSPGFSAFSRDGKTMLVKEAMGTERLWDFPTRRPLGPVLKQNSFVRARARAFHPDGKTVLTAGDDAIVRFWIVATGRLLDELPLDTPGQTELAFSRDGRSFLTSTFDSMQVDRPEEGSRPPPSATQLWDTATRLPLGAPFDQGGSLSSALSPDGTMVLTGGANGLVQFWRVPTPLDGEVERISLWVQVSTGLELTTEGRGRVLGADTWQDSRRHLEQLGGPPRP
jgi:WD40 repeat protein